MSIMVILHTGVVGRLLQYLGGVSPSLLFASSCFTGAVFTVPGTSTPRKGSEACIKPFGAGWTFPASSGQPPSLEPFRLFDEMPATPVVSSLASQWVRL